LLAELESASATLAIVARQDEETRAVALRDLERYDALVAAQAEAEAARGRAREVREQAEAFAQHAFADEARAAGLRGAPLAGRSGKTTPTVLTSLASWRSSLGGSTVSRSTRPRKRSASRAASIAETRTQQSPASWISIPANSQNRSRARSSASGHAPAFASAA